VEGMIHQQTIFVLNRNGVGYNYPPA